MHDARNKRTVSLRFVISAPIRGDFMFDVMMLVIGIVGFAVFLGYVSLCERM